MRTYIPRPAIPNITGYAPPAPLWSATQTRATYMVVSINQKNHKTTHGQGEADPSATSRVGLCEVTARGQAVESGVFTVCDTNVAWCRGPRTRVLVPPNICICIHTYPHKTVCARPPLSLYLDKILFCFGASVGLTRGRGLLAEQCHLRAGRIYICIHDSSLCLF